jgi:hypothetical protein
MPVVMGSGIVTAEKAAADRELADRALRSAFAFAVLAMGMASVNAPPLVPGEPDDG